MGTHRNPSPIVDGSSGDDACKSYVNYKRDVQLLKEMGVKVYRFSLSWPRILPDGTPNSINWKGVEYYNNLIYDLLSNGIEPFVTLYHWDLPQALQEKGGWMNEDITDWFVDYAKVCFYLFGDKVKYWLTFNEPKEFLGQGYQRATMAPGLKDLNIYAGAHYMLKAHAKSWKLYNEQFRQSQKGMVGITLNCDMMIPLTDKEEDIEAAERGMQFELGWFASPIYSSTGDYPSVMREIIDRKSKEQGLPESLLPYFTEEEIQEIKGSSDFFGLNHYTTQLINNAGGENMGDYHGQKDESWPHSGSDWLQAYPEGFRLLVNWIKDHYNNPPLYVTENGWSDNTGTLQDSSRVNYFKTYLTELQKAIEIDKCDVKGYMAWSLMDNFEWARGYTERFGIHQVDFDDPNRKRTPKDSANYLQQVFKENRIPS